MNNFLLQRRTQIRAYLRYHNQAGMTALQQIRQTPLATLMTLAVIAITLALPTALFVLLQNLQILTKSWDNGTTISLYLKLETSETQAKALQQKIQIFPEVSTTHYISPDQGLAELKQQADMAEVVAELPDNPLPGVIEVVPVANVQSSVVLEKLLENLKILPGVENAQLDLEWVKRLDSFIQLSKQAIYALASLLGLAVLLIIGNTIRLITQNYSSEMEVIQLVGGTNAYIRRPFLYIGVYYGLLGGLSACLLVEITLWWLSKPTEQLARLYHSSFYLLGLDGVSFINLMLIGALLGWIGSYLAVGRYL